MRRLLVALALALAGCGSPRAAREPVSPATPAGTRAQTSRDRLVAELRRIEAPKAVLAGLSSAARADLDKLVMALSEEERSQLTAADGPWPKLRPLLHLTAGGSSPDALYELATSGRASDELVQARQHAGGTSFADLVPSARAVIERASARWLRDRAGEVASPRAATVALCDQIDDAAIALELVSLRRLARELAAELESTSARHADVATAAAWELDLPAARRALAAARAASKQESDQAVIAAAERTLAAAEPAHAARGKPLDLDAALLAARANLTLARSADALSVIAPHARLERTHLGVATVRVMAESPRLVCPGLPIRAAHPLLCALSWSEDRRVREGLTRIERAWSSGGGRDEAAIGSYLGLVHFMPWIYGSYQPDGAAAFPERIERVRVPLRAAVAVSREFAGVLLFVDTFAAMYEAATQRKPGERVHLSESVQNQLLQRASELAKQLPDHRFSQAGILAVATALTQERDVAPILALLPPTIDHAYTPLREVLRLWTAVAERDTQRLDQASGALAARLSKTPGNVDSAELVLLLAEARAAALGTPREHDVLAKIGEQLMSKDVPTELRLRAAIDRAGALARGGDQAQAERTLESVLTNLSVQPGSREVSLAATAWGYLLVLRARSARGDERAELRKKLTEIDQDTSGQLPASILAWRDLWLAELDRLEADDKCGAMKACRARAAKSRVDGPALATRVGAVSAKVMRGGTLTAGGMQLNFSFSVEDGLVPIVVFEPLLLAIELPPR